MKLAEWAQRHGISRRTAYNRFHAGQIPHARRLGNGYIVVDPSPEECGGACCEEIHTKCLVEKLRADGYIVRHRDDPEDA